MLETNLNNFPEEKKYRVDLKTETEGDDIREEIKDNTIRRIYVQRKSLKGPTVNLKEKLNYTLKEANDEKLSQK